MKVVQLLSIAASTIFILQKGILFQANNIKSHEVDAVHLEVIDFWGSCVYISFVKSVSVLWLYETYKHQEFTPSFTLVHI